MNLQLRAAALFFLAAASVFPQKAPTITTPKEALGFNIGDDYQMAT
jgi:hypothetical protein